MSWLSIALLLLSACSSTGGAAQSSSTLGNPSKDRLAAILARGTLVLPTDPKYPPASFAVRGAKRATDTKCAANQLTGPEVDGYDVAVGKAVAAALGVEPCPERAWEFAPLSHRSSGHAIEVPAIGHSLEHVLACVLEGQFRTGDEVLDGLRDEDLGGAGEGPDAGADHDTETRYVSTLQ